MDLEAIGDYVLPWDLRDTLLAVGVDLTFWDGRQPRVPDASIEEAAVGEWSTGSDRRGALEILQSGAGGYGTFALLTGGDQAAETGNLDGALTAYSAALLFAATPDIQAEVAYLLARRARVDPAPLCEVDLDGEPIGQVVPLFDEDSIGGPAFPNVGALKQLALSAYGIVYDYYLQEASHSGRTPAAANDMERQLLILDGLRTLFLEYDMLRDAELTCDVFDIWNEVTNDCFIHDYLDTRFADTRGYVRGRSAETKISEASHIVRAIEDKGRAHTMAKLIAEEMASLPLTEVAHFARCLEERARPRVGSPSRDCKTPFESGGVYARHPASQGL